MILDSLTNHLGRNVPLLSPVVFDLPWYLPPRSAANRSATTASLTMGPGIFGSFGNMIDAGPAGFARLARQFLSEDGFLADPEAAPMLTLTAEPGAPATLDLGGGHVLLLDADKGLLSVAHHPSGAQTPIWGNAADGAPPLAQESWFGLDNGTALAIETAPASDHADAFMAARIDVTREGRTTTFRPAA